MGRVSYISGTPVSRYEDYMRLAAEARLLSPMRVKVGAVLVKGGRVIKVASNMPGGSCKHLSQWSRHAEVRATLNVDARGGTVYVYRAHGLTGLPMLAKPCHNCEGWLNYIGVKQVKWST